MLGGVFFFQAEDGIRDLVRSRGLGDVYKRQLRDIEAVIALVVAKQDIDLAIEIQIDDLEAKGLALSLIHI